MKKRELKRQQQLYREAAEGLRQEKLVETSDNWSPNFEGNRVRVHILPLVVSPEGAVTRWRLAVSGKDDTRMELDLDSKEEAFHLYENITGPVSFKLLLLYGFSYQ